MGRRHGLHHSTAGELGALGELEDVGRPETPGSTEETGVTGADIGPCWAELGSVLKVFCWAGGDSDPIHPPTQMVVPYVYS